MRDSQRFQAINLLLVPVVILLLAQGVEQNEVKAGFHEESRNSRAEWQDSQSMGEARGWLDVATRLEALGQPDAARQALNMARSLDAELAGVEESFLRLDMSKCPRVSEGNGTDDECRWVWTSVRNSRAPDNSSPTQHGTVSITRVDYGDCRSLLFPPEDGIVGTSFSLDAESGAGMADLEAFASGAKMSAGNLGGVGNVFSPRHITDLEEVDIVAVEGCEKAGGGPKPWHSLHVQLSGMEEPGLLSWVQGTDPFLSARLFCRFEGLSSEALLPLYSVIVARNAAQSLRALNPRAPPWDIPRELLSRFTMEGKIQVARHYVDESAAEARDNYNFGFYAASRAEIERMVGDVQQRQQNYYGETDHFLYSALDARGGLQGRSVVVMGSLEPWYEAVCIAYGAASCATIEYNALQFDHPLLRTYRSEEFFALQERPSFDVGFSISSFEHDGLGRYGDELDPEGDFRAMHEMESVIKPDGVLYLAVPVGQDLIKWNAHRKYGRVRLAALLANWTLVSHAGLSLHRLDDPSPDTHFQPVLVLQNRRPPTSSIDWDRLLSE